MHTISVRAAKYFSTFALQRAISSAAVAGVKEGHFQSWPQAQPAGWDVPTVVSETLKLELQSLVNLTNSRQLVSIPAKWPDDRLYNDKFYEIVVFTDASAEGWGAMIKIQFDDPQSGYPEGTYEIQSKWTSVPLSTRAHTRFSADTEPTAAKLLLNELKKLWPNASRVALVTDHEAIPRASRRSNGFGGIGRGQALNEFFRVLDESYSTDSELVDLYYICGHLNPADYTSRHFSAACDTVEVVINSISTVLPPLSRTLSFYEQFSTKRREPWQR